MGVRAGLACLTAGMLAALGAAAPACASGAATRASSGAGLRSGVPLPDMGPDGQWWFTAWQIPKVWAAGARGQGITVAVADSGVQASRPELRGVVLPGTDYHGGDGRTDHSRQVDGDDRGHGSAMAINIAGQGGGTSGLVGVAPEAKILPIVRQQDDGDVARNIRWAVDHGARVINMSYYEDGACSVDDQAAVRYAIDHNAIVVTGPGNNGTHSQRSVTRPSNCLGVLSVAALDNQLRAWSRSNRGPFVGLAAPGAHILSVDLTGATGWTNGTSDSSALTSGVIALVWSKYPQLTSRQVLARVLATARDLGAPGKDDVYGYGAVRPYQAITAQVPSDAPNPIFDQLAGVAPTTSAGPSASSAGGPPGTSSGSVPGDASGSQRPGTAGLGVRLLLVLVGGGVLLGGAVVIVVLVWVSRRRAGVPARVPQGLSSGGPPGR
jgi:hypothetical protein